MYVCMYAFIHKASNSVDAVINTVCTLHTSFPQIKIMAVIIFILLEYEEKKQSMYV